MEREKRILGKKISRVKSAQPSVLKNKVSKFLINVSVDEYKVLLKQANGSQSEFTEADRIKMNKILNDFQNRQKEMSSLNSTEQIKSNVNNVNQNTNCHEYKPLVQDQILDGLNNLNSMKQNIIVKVIKTPNSRNKKIVQNNESSNDDSKKKLSNKPLKVIKFLNHNFNKNEIHNKKSSINQLQKADSSKIVKVKPGNNENKKVMTDKILETGKITGNRNNMFIENNGFSSNDLKKAMPSMIIKTVQNISNKNKIIVHNNESYDNDSNIIRPEKIEANQISIEDNLLNSENSNNLISEVPCNVLYGPYKKIQKKYIPNILVQNKFNSNYRISAIIQPIVINQVVPVNIVHDSVTNQEIAKCILQPTTNQELPITIDQTQVIKQKIPTTIAPKQFVVQNSKLIQKIPIPSPQPIIIKNNQQIIQTNLVNKNSVEIHQNTNIPPLKRVLKQTNCKVQYDNSVQKLNQQNVNEDLLNINVAKKNNAIFPVALKISDSNNFECVKLLTNNTLNENEMEILGF